MQHRMKKKRVARMVRKNKEEYMPNMRPATTAQAPHTRPAACAQQRVCRPEPAAAAATAAEQTSNSLRSAARAANNPRFQSALLPTIRGAAANNRANQGRPPCLGIVDERRHVGRDGERLGHEVQRAPVGVQLLRSKNDAGRMTRRPALLLFFKRHPPEHIEGL